MDHRERLQSSLDYIEENLRAELTQEELATMAGYSLAHYCRLFHAATGMSVGHYILRRRLLHAGYAIARGSSGIDTALSYGFGTYAGLYRAFVREFGDTPSEYLRSKRGRKPWRIDLTKEENQMMTHKDAARVLKRWGLAQERLKDMLVEGTGAQRDNLIAVGESYFLKRTADAEKLENQLALTKKLATMGLLAPVPVPAASGEEYLKEGTYCYTLTERLPGHPLTALELLEPNLAWCEGKAIAGLHRALEGLDTPVEDVDLLASVRSWAVPKAKEALGLTAAWCEAFLTELETLMPELPRQIIHRDLCPGNLVRDGEDWGFLDFELSQRNVRIFDAVYAASAVLSETFPDHADRWPGCWRALLEGYGPTEPERRAAPLVLLANQMICVAWCAGQEKHRELFETNKRMTLWLLERFEELK